VALVGFPPDAKAIAGLTPLDEAFVGLVALIRPALGPTFTLDCLPAVVALATLVPAATFEVAALVPAAAFFYKHILKSKV